MCCYVMWWYFRCTIKYDAKHLQVNKDTKLSKNLFKGFMFVSKTICNKPCTKTRNNCFYKNEKKWGKKPKKKEMKKKQKK